MGNTLEPKLTGCCLLIPYHRFLLGGFKIFFLLLLLLPLPGLAFACVLLAAVVGGFPRLGICSHS